MARVRSVHHAAAPVHPPALRAPLAVGVLVTKDKCCGGRAAELGSVRGRARTLWCRWSLRRSSAPAGVPSCQITHWCGLSGYANGNTVLALRRITVANRACSTRLLTGEPGAERPMSIPWPVAVIHGVDVEPADRDGAVDEDDPMVDAPTGPVEDKASNPRPVLPPQRAAVGGPPRAAAQRRGSP
jgi:hypothetical protein